MAMNTQEIAKKVKEVLVRNLKIDQTKISLDSSLVDDLGMDSFSSVETMFEMEEEFGIEIPEKDLAEVKTVKDIVNVLFQTLSSKK